MDEKVKIQKQSYLRPILLLGTLTIISLPWCIENLKFLPLSIILGLLFITFILVRKYSGIEVVASFDSHGIYLYGGSRLIKWNEIEQWEYYPGNIRFPNYLRLKTNYGNEFTLENFSYIKITKELKKYIPGKGKTHYLPYIIVTAVIVVLFVLSWIYKY